VLQSKVGECGLGLCERQRKGCVTVHEIESSLSLGSPSIAHGGFCDVEKYAEDP